MWEWSDMRKAIDDSDGQFPAMLAKLPRAEIERMLSSHHYWCMVVDQFGISNVSAAAKVYDEIVQRARYGKS